MTIVQLFPGFIVSSLTTLLSLKHINVVFVCLFVSQYSLLSWRLYYFLSLYIVVREKLEYLVSMNYQFHEEKASISRTVDFTHTSFFLYSIHEDILSVSMNIFCSYSKHQWPSVYFHRQKLFSKHCHIACLVSLELSVNLEILVTQLSVVQHEICGFCSSLFFFIILSSQIQFVFSCFIVLSYKILNKLAEGMEHFWEASLFSVFITYKLLQRLVRVKC